jgi:hypothetical protein
MQRLLPRHGPECRPGLPEPAPASSTPATSGIRELICRSSCPSRPSAKDRANDQTAAQIAAGTRALSPKAALRVGRSFRRPRYQRGDAASRILYRAGKPTIDDGVPTLD